MAVHSRILAWRMLWTEEPDWLQSTGLQGDGQNWSNLAHTCITFPFLYNLFLSPKSRRIWESTITFRRQRKHPSTWGFPGQLALGWQGTKMLTIASSDKFGKRTMRWEKRSSGAAISTPTFPMGGQQSEKLKQQIRGPLATSGTGKSIYTYK